MSTPLSSQILHQRPSSLKRGVNWIKRNPQLAFVLGVGGFQGTRMAYGMTYRYFHPPEPAIIEQIKPTLSRYAAPLLGPLAGFVSLLGLAKFLPIGEQEAEGEIIRNTSRRPASITRQTSKKASSRHSSPVSHKPPVPSDIEDAADFAAYAAEYNRSRSATPSSSSIRSGKSGTTIRAAQYGRTASAASTSYHSAVTGRALSPSPTAPSPNPVLAPESTIQPISNSSWKQPGTWSSPSRRYYSTPEPTYTSTPFVLASEPPTGPTLDNAWALASTSQASAYALEATEPASPKASTSSFWGFKRDKRKRTTAPKPVTAPPIPSTFLAKPAQPVAYDPWTAAGATPPPRPWEMSSPATPLASQPVSNLPSSESPLVAEAARQNTPSPTLPVELPIEIRMDDLGDPYTDRKALERAQKALAPLPIGSTIRSKTHIISKDSNEQISFRTMQLRNRSASPTGHVHEEPTESKAQ